MRFDQPEYLFGLEPATFRNHVERPCREVGQGIEARAVAERRGMQDGVAGEQSVDVRKVGLRCEQEVAVRKDRPFGPSRGAAGVEDPRWIVGPYFGIGGASLEVQRVESF